MLAKFAILKGRVINKQIQKQHPEENNRYFSWMHNFFTCWALHLHNPSSPSGSQAAASAIWHRFKRAVPADPLRSHRHVSREPETQIARLSCILRQIHILRMLDWCDTNHCSPCVHTGLKAVYGPRLLATELPLVAAKQEKPGGM